VKAATDALKPGELLVLENVRFYKEEEKNDPAFAEKVRSLGDRAPCFSFLAKRRCWFALPQQLVLPPQKPAQDMLYVRLLLHALP
jgi:hypothetical protein